MKGIVGAIIGIVIVIVINVGYRYYTTSGEDTYLVVDLSGGSSATSYPVTKLSDEPKGGWSEEYKTTKLVLRKITSGDVKPLGKYITITEDYYVGVFEVTQAQWQAIMGENPSYFGGDLSRPVEKVSWNDCQEFIKKLNSRTEVKSAGITFRLPTEEEWEYACRAGSTGKYGLLAEGREGTIDEMGWYDDNSGEETHPVGQKKPNVWGLYDMHGNVWEWTASAVSNYRIYSGGGWNIDVEDCVADYWRSRGDYPDCRGLTLGFRLAASRTEKSVKEIIETMVKIPGEDYFMGKYEVTQAQWQAIMGENPSVFTGDSSRPVENVSWNDCQEFIEKLNARADIKSAGITFRLPTSEEWEYACRARSTGKYGLLADGREGTLDEMGWYKDNSGSKTHPVGQKKPNAWGLYDMHGNVYEWTASEFISARISRGGSWDNSAEYCGVGSRSYNNPDHRNDNFGFRLAASRTGN